VEASPSFAGFGCHDDAIPESPAPLFVTTAPVAPPPLFPTEFYTIARESFSFFCCQNPKTILQNPKHSRTTSLQKKKKEFSTHSLCLKRKICTIKKRTSHFPHFGKIFFLPNRAILHQFEDLNWLRESEMLSNRHPHISERTISGKICFLISLTLNQQKHLFRFLSYSIQSFESLSEMAFESSTIIIYLKRKIINWQFLTNHKELN